MYKFKLTYKRKYDFNKILEFKKIRQIKEIEFIDINIYAKSFVEKNTKGYFVVKNNSKMKELNIEILAKSKEISELVFKKIKRMFDVDFSYTKIYNTLSKESELKKVIDKYPISPLPISYDNYEFFIRLILGQQISISAAVTLAKRIVLKANIKAPKNKYNITNIFPNIAKLKKFDFNGIGITNTRIGTIKNINNALLNKDINLHYEQTFNELYNSLIKIKGVGVWTINCLSMLGFGMHDAFPVNDLGIIKSLNPKKKLTNDQLNKKSLKWSPYRSYATLSIWDSLF